MTNKKTTQPQLSKWKTTDKRFVAFLDLLGFKDKVMRSTHQEIYEDLSKISKLKILVENNSTLKKKQRFRDCDVYVVSFSDSIVVFSKNDSFENFEFFLVALRAIFSNSIRGRIALKGGFAHGEISINKTEQIYFGQPIIDAYLIEEDVNYMGVVAHSSIDNYLNQHENESKNSIFTNKLLFKEKTILKSGKISHINLDWFLLSQRNHENLKHDQKISNIISDIDLFYCTVSGSPRRYIDNTKEMLLMAHHNENINLERVNLELLD